MKSAIAWVALVFIALSAAAGVADETNGTHGRNGTDRSDFKRGLETYAAGDYESAARAFAAAAADSGSGALRNLGNAEWQRGRAGHALHAWEQALWIDPFERATRNNLAFARKTNQLESPRLRWYEIVSTWLPASGWAWLVGVSLWSTFAAVIVPSVLRRPKRTWHQAVAAVSLGVFLLALPADIGTFTRANVGYILENETPLQLTPTTDGEVIGRFASGDPVRELRRHGRFLLVRGPHQTGWITRDRVKFMTDAPGSMGEPSVAEPQLK